MSGCKLAENNDGGGGGGGWGVQNTQGENSLDPIKIY